MVVHFFGILMKVVALFDAARPDFGSFMFQLLNRKSTANTRHRSSRSGIPKVRAGTVSGTGPVTHLPRDKQALRKLLHR